MAAEFAMKKIMLAVCAVVLSAAPLFAQDVTGTWQGTLQAGQSLRTVITIAKEGADLKAVLYSIDQGGQPLAASAIVVQGANVRISFTAARITYEGKLSADGNTIAGTASQGAQPMPLNLVRATPATAWDIPAPVRMEPMAANVAPAFDVVTIKPANPNAQGKGFLVRGRTFSTVNTSLNDLVTFAYGVHAKQVTDGPAWSESEKYDVSGQPDAPGVPNEKQLRAMIAKLLTDRFGLTFHRDKKELSAYVLVLGRSGHKLTKSEGDPNGLPSLIFRGLGALPARNATMADFANVMQSAVMDRPVVDQTGLAGRWDFTLTWTPDESQFGGLGARVPPPADSANAPPVLFTAIQEQLGLRLDSTKTPVDVIVIDRANHPTPD
jgi:uncharacterized protein (TIGR03435 family)